MTKWLGALLGLGGLCVTTAVHAQPYPARPVTIVVTAAAGGLTDIVARAIGQQLSEMWGKPVVIENKGGAGHNIGAAAVAKATSSAARASRTSLMISTIRNLNEAGLSFP